MAAQPQSASRYLLARVHPSRLPFRWMLLISLLVTPALSQESPNRRSPDRVPDQRHLDFLKRNCLDCHEGESGEGGFAVDHLILDLGTEEHFAKWERIHDRLNRGEMPPEDAGQPDPVAKSKFLAELQQSLTAAHAKSKSTMLRRLNRQEYENSLNDLFGIELKLADQLPEDGRAHEFDNVGSALSLSMVHLEKYMAAARQVLDEAIAKTTMQPEIQRIEGSYANTREGEEFIGKIWKQLPDGAVVRFSGGGYPSGMIRSANVRDSGRYRIEVTGYAYQSGQPITFSVGGTTFKQGAEKPIYGYFVFQPGQPQTIELETPIESGYMIQIEPHGIEDPDRYQRKSIADYAGPGLAIQSVVLTGPLMDQFPSRGHRLIFDGIRRMEVEPGDPRQKTKPWYKPRFEIESDNELLDAGQSLERIAAFAFRRKVTADEVKPYLDLFESQRQTGQSFEDSLRQSVTAIFCSPRFLFLQETDGPLNDFEIATRLSYFLQRTMPDRQLLSLAARGKLREPDQILAQAQRLMQSPRFQRFIEDFADAWLNLREMDFTAPDESLFPEYDPYLRYSMPLETYAFVRELLESNLPIRNLVQSDFAMLNERLAEHYGIPDVSGPAIRKVSLPPESLRGGILSQASVLKVSANGTNTSPVVRGVYVLERILGETPLPPPPGVPGIEPDIRGATTLREQLVQHRSLTQCQSCHRKIDPPGFALEFFNPIGGLRDRYRSLGEGERVDVRVRGRKVHYRLGPPVDGSGVTETGEKFEDYRQFRELLVANEKRLARAFTEKLLTFAAGRELGFSDRPEVERIVESTAAGGYRAADLLQAVMTSRIFLHK